jgi:hypothetical protein
VQAKTLRVSWKKTPQKNMKPLQIEGWWDYFPGYPDRRREGEDKRSQTLLHSIIVLQPNLSTRE